LFLWTGARGNNEMFKVSREVTSALKLYFIMQSVPLIGHISIPVSAYLTLHNLVNCIVLQTHVVLVPYSGTFIQNVQSWDKGIFIPFFGQSGFFLKTFLISSYTFFHN
jgi:hypothetical protein